jgi:hypothetical protein
MCIIEFLRQNLAGLMTHPVIVLAGGRIFTAFLTTVQKNTLPMAVAEMT